VLDTGLGVGHETVNGVAEVLAEREGVLEGEAAAGEEVAHDPLGLVPGSGCDLVGVGPVAPPGSRGRGEPDETGEDLSGDAGGALPEPFEQDLGEDLARDVVSAALVADLEVPASGDPAAEVVDGDVACGGGVVQLAVPVAADQARRTRGRRRRHGHNITHRVIDVKIMTHRGKRPVSAE